MISALLGLPKELFNPIVLWIAVLLTDWTQRPAVRNDRASIRQMYFACLFALGVKCGRDGSSILERDMVIEDNANKNCGDYVYWNEAVSWYIDSKRTFAASSSSCKCGRCCEESVVLSPATTGLVSRRGSATKDSYRQPIAHSSPERERSS